MEHVSKSICLGEHNFFKNEGEVQGVLYKNNSVYFALIRSIVFQEGIDRLIFIFLNMVLNQVLNSISYIITWLSEICLTSLIALFWNFPELWRSFIQNCHSRRLWRLRYFIQLLLPYSVHMKDIFRTLLKIHDEAFSWK